VRRLLILGMVFAALGACAYDPGPIRPGVTAATGVSAPGAPAAPSGPTTTAPAFTAEGCPVDDPAFCQQAALLANALVLGDGDAVFGLARAGRFDCADLDEETFPQCSRPRALEGYAIHTYQDETFVQSSRQFRRLLRFLVEAVDPDYEDELRTSAMQILGISTCGRGDTRTYHVVYTAGLNDRESTLPPNRFLGTYGFERRDDEWAIGISYVGLYTDWQLALDDPLTQIACGHIEPWPSG